MYTLLRTFALLAVTACSLRAQALNSSDWTVSPNLPNNPVTPSEAVWTGGSYSFQKTDGAGSTTACVTSGNWNNAISFGSSWNFTTTITMKAFEDGKFGIAGQMMQSTVIFQGGGPNTYFNVGTAIFSTNGRYDNQQNGPADFTLAKLVTWNFAAPTTQPILYISDKNKTNLVPSWDISPGGTISADVAYSYDNGTNQLSNYFRQTGSNSDWTLISSFNLVNFDPDPNNHWVSLALNFGTWGTTDPFVAAVDVVPGDMAATAFSFEQGSAGSFSAVPEPSTYAAIMSVAALGVGALRKRKKAQVVAANT